MPLLNFLRKLKGLGFRDQKGFACMLDELGGQMRGRQGLFFALIRHTGAGHSL